MSLMLGSIQTHTSNLVPSVGPKVLIMTLHDRAHLVLVNRQVFHQGANNA